MKRLFLITGLALLAGCSPELSDSSPLPVPHAKPVGDTLGSDELLKQLDDALEFTYTRRLNTQEHAGWQILHGCLAYQREFLIEHEGKEVPAVDFLLSGGKITGWDFEPGIVLDEATGRRGLRAITQPGTKTGQGHEDQWLGYLSECKLSLDEDITVNGQTYKVADYIAQIEYDVPRNVQKEYSWTLMALTQYRNHDYTWTASDGNEWSIARLVEIELGHELESSPCGGTHRMVGLTLAYNRFKQQGGQDEGVWQQLHDRIEKCIENAQKFQNDDGTLSSNYFLRPGRSVDLADSMGSAGHVLEFLMIALDDQRLQQPWVKRAVQAQCKIFRVTKKVNIECGALYHAAHGLRLYRERVYGPRTFAAS
jgi:hypothetical protein